jgi:hypothetical protein
MVFVARASESNVSFCAVGSPPEKTTPLIASRDPRIISTISSVSRSSFPASIVEFWQYAQRTGHPRKNTVQADRPRQSTVDSGTKPPKFSLIEITVPDYFFKERLFDCIKVEHA